MNAIRIRRKLESETLHLPELKDLVGREVEIIVLEEDRQAGGVQPGTGDWDAVKRAVLQLQDYDHAAQLEQDACDLSRADEHLP